MTITKSDLSEFVCQRLDIPKARSTQMVETLLKLIKDTLENGEDVLVSGFGKFCVREKGERRGRNPATGEDMMLRARKVVTFQCSSSLRAKIN